mgnify:CR=1 FL=1
MNTNIVRPTQIRAGSIKTHWSIKLLMNFKTSVVGVLAGLLLSMGSVTVHAEPEIPHYSGKARLGTQTCGGSTCHGAVKPWANSAVLQNEFVTWSTEDPHSGAYKALSSDRGKRSSVSTDARARREQTTSLTSGRF